MSVLRCEAPPEGGRRSPTYETLVDVKADAEATGYDGWYEIGTWKSRAAASMVRRGIERYNTEARSRSDQKTPPGQWEARLDSDESGAVTVKVRYVGEEAR